MTGTAFKNLCQDDEIVIDGKTYRVEDTDLRMGRVQLQKMKYYIDVWNYRDEYYDSYEEAQEAASNIVDDLKENLKELTECLSDLDADDEDYDDTQEEIDKTEELIDDLEFCDFDTEEFGKPFWMHYKDIEEDISYD